MIENKIRYRMVPLLTDLTTKWSQKARKSENLKKSKEGHSSIFFKKQIRSKLATKCPVRAKSIFFVISTGF
jgi:hypothetical protein